jgi:hypothetical protein
VVNWSILFADVGLITVLLVLAALMAWRLIDLFKREGRWSREREEGEVIR